ncbi:MAG: hypothetical protein MI674_07510 [Cytophagales bacterium]|nr:hypothetical protein [Cytophagales bacterium]
MGLRAGLGAYANLRPAVVLPQVMLKMVALNVHTLQFSNWVNLVS